MTGLPRARAGRAARRTRRTRRGRRGGSSGQSRSLSSTRCGSPCRRGPGAPLRSPSRRPDRRGGVVALVVRPSSIVLVWPCPVRRSGLGRRPPRRAGPAGAGAVGVAVVVSVYLSAHLVDVVARIGGFGRPAVLVAAVLIAVGTVAFAAAPSSVAGPVSADPHWPATATRSATTAPPGWSPPPSA